MVHLSQMEHVLPSRPSFLNHKLIVQGDFVLVFNTYMSYFNQINPLYSFSIILLFYSSDKLLLLSCCPVMWYVSSWRERMVKWCRCPTALCQYQTRLHFL
jgi:hypothetical protein